MNTNIHKRSETKNKFSYISTWMNIVANPRKLAIKHKQTFANLLLSHETPRNEIPKL